MRKKAHEAEQSATALKEQRDTCIDNFAHERFEDAARARLIQQCEMLKAQRSFAEMLPFVEQRVRFAEGQTATINVDRRNIDVAQRQMELNLAEVESALKRLQKDEEGHSKGATPSTLPAPLAPKEDGNQGEAHTQKQNKSYNTHTYADSGRSAGGL